jgi:hypothetical protein
MKDTHIICRRSFDLPGITRMAAFSATLLFSAFTTLSCQVKPTPSETVSGSQVKPEDGSGAFATGKYRNLFLENGHAQMEISARNEAAFQQLFHGDSSKSIYFEAGRNENGLLAYVSDVLHNDVRSEGKKPSSMQSGTGR